MYVDLMNKTCEYGERMKWNRRNLLNLDKTLSNLKKGLEEFCEVQCSKMGTVNGTYWTIDVTIYIYTMVVRDVVC